MNVEEIREVIKNYKTGDKFKCKIKDIDVEGIIVIKNKDIFYLLHNVQNENNLDGSNPKKDYFDGGEMYGYNYGWQCDHRVSCLVITKKDSIINNYNIY